MAKIQFKQRPLAITLTISLVLNALALVGLFVFVQSQKRIKSLKAENARLETAALAAKRAPEDRQGTIQLREFVSHLDSQSDSYLLVPPRAIARGDKFVLVVYFHCMGGDVNEPFLSPPQSTVAQIVAANGRQYVLASLSYRKKVSWCNQAACADATQNIRELMQAYPVEKIILVGTSMGGSAVLTYSAIAPDDIKKLISGVVSVIGAGDLAALYRTTAADEIRRALIESFGGTPETSSQYATQSFSTNIDKVNPQAKFAIVSASHDMVVPTALQKEAARQLQDRHITVKFIEFPGPHGSPPSKVYREALRSVL